jgi:hypothetical protein
MYKYSSSSVHGASVVSTTDIDAFGMRSRQELVRDDVAFAPGVDPLQGLLADIQRLREARPSREVIVDEDVDSDDGVLSAG